jgi:hypothetical protein
MFQVIKFGVELATTTTSSTRRATFWHFNVRTSRHEMAAFVHLRGRQLQLYTTEYFGGLSLYLYSPDTFWIPKLMNSECLCLSIPKSPLFVGILEVHFWSVLNLHLE